MNKNSFGKILTITTWGESHSDSIGVVIDGCPAGIHLSEEDFIPAMEKRRPGNKLVVSQRQEPDIVQLLSGVFNQTTTGAPISLLIQNKNARPQDYALIENIHRPGHANLSYLNKFGIFDYRGGGRSSARETAARVAAGVVAAKILTHYDIFSLAYLSAIGEETPSPFYQQFSPQLKLQTERSPIFCPHPSSEKRFLKCLKTTMKEKDSIGGVVSFVTSNIPYGLGEPIYYKIQAILASAIFSIPGVKGFEIGDGFFAAKQKGSQYIDPITPHLSSSSPSTNRSGGSLGGISINKPLTGKVAFKPTSSIGISIPTTTTSHEITKTSPSTIGRHDPCITIRAVPVVEAMINLSLADLLLWNRSAQL